MANTFLNKDGLSHLVSKLKTYIASQISAHTSNKSNPHGVTKSQVGLGSVTNIDQSKAIKSITRSGTTFTATALDGTQTTFDQQDSNTTYGNMKGASTSAAGSAGLAPAPAAGAANRYLRSDGTWAVPPDSNTTYGVASSSSNGLMSAGDKAKLDGIAAGANKYTHPAYTAKSSGLYKVTVDGTGHVSAATAVTKADITALGIPGQDTNTTYSDATTSAHGLMTAADKSKLNGIASGATKNISTVKSFTLSASSWSSGAYTISDSLITASSNQEVLPATTITAAQYNALSKAQIIDGGQSAGKLTLKALGTVPTIDIPIRVIFRGTI
ncbi:hypothetical protein FYJ51_01910 [Erysipelotrichaceae bacterium Oil+RF-744-GAM-WT-6]|uniref:Uncharacterized protein n=1 Tax=Stecheria intestinalis TaxID=2606630 RepID=A0A7X2TFP4_9FIRM|nr:hypothetical protein [Stecheria intestinalis]MSS57666.1 hypothetical protein [Stecheria intestinalis]